MSEQEEFYLDAAKQVPPEPPPVVREAGIKRSATIGKLIAALCKAQLEFGPVVKSNVNPQFKSKYADLATIINATMPALAKNGLAIIQTPYVEGRELTMTTMLVHSSEEWISNELTMPATMRGDLTAQTIGSACTYSRRYALQSLLGIAADNDDDGTEASGGGTKEAAQAVAQEKIADLKAKKAKPDYIPGLFYSQQPSGLWAITGDTDLLRKLYKQYSKQWYQQDKCYMVGTEDLEQVKFQCESATPPIPFSVLKGE